MKLQKSSPRHWVPKRINSKMRRDAERLQARMTAFIIHCSTPNWIALDRSVIARARIRLYEGKKLRVGSKPNRAIRRSYQRLYLREGIGTRYVFLNKPTISLWEDPIIRESK